MKRTFWRDWPMPRRIALGALIVALGIDLALLLRIGHVGAESSARPLDLGRVPAVKQRQLVDPSLVLEAAAKRPFGGEPSVSQSAPGMVTLQTVSDPDRPHLIGTVVEGDGKGFVVVELPDSRMQIVRIGERAGTLRLRSVTAGAAVFEDAHGERVSLRSPQAGAGSLR